MTIPQKLQTIQRLSGLSQTELAQKLGVSFVAFNRWITGKVVPRERAQERIDALYREYTGLKVIPEEALEAKKAIVTGKSNKAKHVLYLFKHLSVKKPVHEELILELHGILMNGIRTDAGSYRHHGVRIVGADLPTANYLKVPQLMGEFAADLHNSRKDIIGHIAVTHARFEQIHPFSDGNGRIGRLLMHAMLLQKNLPPAVIRPEKKRFYYSSLNKAQRQGDASLLQDFICDGVLEGWDIVERK